MSETTYLIVDDRVRANCLTAVAMAPIGREVVIRPKRKTSPQRRLFHDLLSRLCEGTGYELIELKTIVKRQVLGVKTFTDRKGQQYERDYSSEELDTKTYGLLIDRCYLLGKMAGISLPLPNHFGME